MNPSVSRREVLRALGATGAFAALSQYGLVRAQERRLVIPTYGGRYEKFWREVLLPPFQQNTGLQPVLDIGVAGTFAANLRTTGPEKPVYSYLMANDVVGSVLRAEGFFEAWPVARVPNLKKVHAKANPDNNQGITVMFSPIGIAYRSDLMTTPPRSWKDLWDRPELKGKVGLYEITNTAGYSFLMTTSKIYGSGPFDFDAGFRQIERLKPFPQAALAGALAVLLTRGEITAGPLDIGETLTLKKKGVPVDWVAPAEGMFMFDQTFSLLKRGPNKDGAYAFLDYMLSEEVQIKLAREFYAIPVNTTVKIPADLAREVPFTVNDLDKILAFDWLEANKQRAAVIERWNRLSR
ncbi:MAG: ABC transporter substrate-binding protein [Burkholderiales bacterium]